jgi:hypothetical protein
MTIHLTDMLNSMRSGRIYTASTSTGDEITGEYLGYEVVHGEWSILLRDDDITVSLPLEGLDTVLLSTSTADITPA